ncbi:hypothetical protein BH23VER1_BH23VER1_13070 [soil metagenome]
MQTILRGARYSGPSLVATVPANSWAFVFGHEFAHQIHGFGHRGGTDPDQESRADVIGAEYAMRAGCDLSAHLAWMLARRDHGSASHGFAHDRAWGLAARFGIPRGDLPAGVRRYQR